MKGWFTVDILQVIEAIRPYGRLRTIDDSDLVVETADRASTETLSKILAANLKNEVWLDPIQKKSLA